MPARDVLHQVVKDALIRDGWIITDDPLTIAFGARRVYVDLGAERLLAATKGTQEIAIEVKSFVGASPVYDLERAIGQYAVYKSWIARVEPDRLLYLAVDAVIFNELFQDISGQVLLIDYDIKLIVVDSELAEVVKWIN